jgi:hypothetical protein
MVHKNSITFDEDWDMTNTVGIQHQSTFGRPPALLNTLIFQNIGRVHKSPSLLSVRRAVLAG